MEVVEENTPISRTNNVEEEDSDVEEKKTVLGKANSRPTATNIIFTTNYNSKLICIQGVSFNNL